MCSKNHCVCLGELMQKAITIYCSEDSWYYDDGLEDFENELKNYENLRIKDCHGSTIFDHFSDDDKITKMLNERQKELDENTKKHGNHD